MRQNRDGSEAFSVGACVSAGRGFCLCLGAFLPTARSPRFLPRNFEFCALSGSELLALLLRFSPWILFPLSLPDCVPLAFPSSASVPAQSVCLFGQVPGPKQTFDPPSWHGTAGPQEGRRSLYLPAPVPLPVRPRQPRRPARSHLVFPAGAAAAAAIYARRGRARSFKPRFPGAQCGPTRSQMAPVAANHVPLPPPARPAGAAEPL